MAKKRMKNKYVALICIMICIVLQIIISPMFRYGNTSAEMGASAATIVSANNYDISDNEFVPNDDDPFFIISNTVYNSKKITIYLDEKLANDTTIQIYCGNDNEFDEKHSIISKLDAGKKEYVIDIGNGHYNTIRFDIDGEFVLDHIAVSGTKRIADNTKFAIYIFICLVLDFILYIQLRKVTTLNKMADDCCEYLKKFPTNIHKSFTSINVYIYEIGIKNKINISKVFIIVGSIMGVSFSVLIPPAQVPDEPSHFRMIETEIGLSGYSDQCEEYLGEIGAGTLMGDATSKLNVHSFISHLGDKFTGDNLSISIVPNKLMIRHLPAAIGLLIGILLGLPIYFCLQLAEFFALIFYLFIGKKALDIMPVKKELLCAVMLLPMTVQQCASLNYDAVMMPVAFFLTAYIFHCKYNLEKVKWNNVAFVILLTGIIAVIKAPFALLILLMLIVPLDKYDLNIFGKVELGSFIKRFRVLIIAGCCVILGAGVYICRNVVYVKIIIASVQNFPRYAYLLVRTLGVSAQFYLQSIVGDFGWLDTLMPTSFMIFVYVMLFLFAQAKDNRINNEYKVNIWTRTISILTFITMTVLILTVMISWSFTLAGYDLNGSIADFGNYIYSIDFIEGVQGRYFIPYMLCFFIGISGIGRIRNENLSLLQLMYYSIIVINPINVLINRYWI